MANAAVGAFAVSLTVFVRLGLLSLGRRDTVVQLYSHLKMYIRWP